MNKNTLIGSILMAVIVIWWMTMNSQRAEAEAQAKARAHESSTISVAKADFAEELVLSSVEKIPEMSAPPVLGESSLENLDSLVKDSLVDSTAKSLDSNLAVVLPRIVTVETEKFIMTLDNKGGKVRSVILKALTDSLSNFPELIQDTTQGALDLQIGKANLNEVLFYVNAPEWITVDSDTSVEFTFSDINGNKVIRSYAFTKSGEYVRQVNKFIGFKPNDYKLSWNGGMRETEEIPKGKSFGGASYFFSEVIFNNTQNVEREMVREEETFNKENGNLIWAGMRRKYVAMSVQYDKPVPAVLHTKFLKVPENDKDPGTYQISLQDNLRGSDSLSFNLMILPLQWDELESLNQDYEKVIVSGWTWCGANVWFVWICKMLLKLLKLFYEIIPNYGVAIILVTFIVRGITTPFTVKQLKSTRGMAKLKPQIDEINVKYRTDPQKKQAAMMELYSKNNINPLASCTGGCLPMLIQMPIFMGLFFVLGRAMELRGMPAFLWITDLSKSDVVWSGFSIPFIMPSGLAILPWIMVVTTYFQTKVTMTNSAGMDPAQQKMMVWMMPAMMFFFSAVMPSGLVLYWIVSNIWSIVQYKVINRDLNASNTSEKLKGKNVKEARIVK